MAKKIDRYILPALFDSLLLPCVYFVIFYNFYFGLGPKASMAYIENQLVIIILYIAFNHTILTTECKVSKTIDSLLILFDSEN